MLLVDSSAWIEAIADRIRLVDYVGGTEIATCPVIFQEVLQGIRSETAWRRMRDTLLAAAMLEEPMELAVFEEAVQIYRSGRNAGFTIRKPNDCLVAAIAIRHAVPLLHADRDFDAIARFTRLQAINVVS